jgi:hypothetical protein
MIPFGYLALLAAGYFIAHITFRKEVKVFLSTSRAAFGYWFTKKGGESCFS